LNEYEALIHTCFSFELTVSTRIVTPNGVRYWRWGGRGFCLGAGKNPKLEKCPKMPQNPQRPVHALLGAFYQNTFPQQKTLSF